MILGILILAALGLWGIFLVSRKTEPTFARPNDTGTASGSWSNTLPKGTALSSPDNITTKAADDLLTTYLTARQETGQELTAEERAQVAADAATKLTASTTPATVYTLADLVVVEDGATEDRAFGNALGALFATYTKNYTTDEIAIMKQAFADKSAAELAALAPNASAYRHLAEDMTKIAVPRAFADIHLKLINDYSQMGAALIDIQSVFTDGLRGTVGITTYTQAFNDTFVTVLSMADLFIQHKVLFSQDEPGAVFRKASQ